MESEKYNRSVSLLCPTCGNGEFEYDEDDLDRGIKCLSCGRIFSRDELVEENGAIIEANVEAIGEEFMKDAAGELRAMLQKTFRGSKMFKVK